MKPEIERLAVQSEALKRKLQQAKPALDKAKIKDLVAKGLVFFTEKVLGTLSPSASKTATAIKGYAVRHWIKTTGQECAWPVVPLDGAGEEIRSKRQ